VTESERYKTAMFATFLLNDTYLGGRTYSNVLVIVLPVLVLSKSIVLESMSKKQLSEDENRKYGLHCWAIVRVNLLCNVMNPRKRDYPRRRSDSLSDRPIKIAGVVIA